MLVWLFGNPGYKNLADKFPEECRESNILESVKFAENVLNEDVENRGKQ